MPIKVKSYTAKRGSKTTVVREHTKAKFRTVRSSFIDRISEDGEGGYIITIKGKDYPYPYLPDFMVGGIVRGSSGSSGKYYNKNIRSRWF